ncbi:MAG: hypothetical protein KDK51_10345, partial [Deltaproteobacteria bacterium]|nr:hypothetical protein [Deltaproteobacteria bacterium]
QLDKIPYMLIVGDEEVKQQTCSLRTKGQEQKGQTIADVLAQFQLEEK